VGLNVIALAIPFFFALIAVEALVARAKGRRVYRLADALTNLGCGVGREMGALLFSGLQAVPYALLYEHRLFTLPTWAQWLVAIVGVDFIYYWWHRLSHEVNFMWAAHVVHHQSEDFNLAVALRQSITTSWTGLPFYLPLALLGVGVVPFAISSALSLLYQFWIHTELIGPLPRFERLFNSPSAHRVHHGINPRYLDKNYAGTLLIWDRLFGTYEPEGEKVVYGVTHPFGSFNPLWAQLAGYADMVVAMRRAPNVGQALQVIFRGPSWRPPWLGEGAPSLPQVKYEVQTGTMARRYALGWFALAVVATFCLELWGHSLTTLQAGASAALVLLTLTCIGGLLEGRRWVRVLEPLRYAALLAFVPLWL
jgi:sterol desaturase/sphingolipid hydroxylase (fatty acid hydroxylase superfamily)